MPRLERRDQVGGQGDRGADHNEDNAKLPALALRDTLMDK